MSESTATLTPPAVETPPPAVDTQPTTSEVETSPKPVTRKPQKARAKASTSRTRTKKVEPEPGEVGFDLSVLIQDRINEALVQAGVMRAPDPEPTLEPEELGFYEVLWLAGDSSVTRQPKVYIEGSRNPVVFARGFCVFRGELGEKQYNYMLEHYKGEVYVPNWDVDTMGPWPVCHECGWMVPNFRAFQVHSRLHQKRTIED